MGSLNLLFQVQCFFFFLPLPTRVGLIGTPNFYIDCLQDGKSFLKTKATRWTYKYLFTNILVEGLPTYDPQRKSERIKNCTPDVGWTPGTPTTAGVTWHTSARRMPRFALCTTPASRAKKPKARRLSLRQTLAFGVGPMEARGPQGRAPHFREGWQLPPESLKGKLTRDPRPGHSGTVSKG